MFSYNNNELECVVGLLFWFVTSQINVFYNNNVLECVVEVLY